MSKEIRLLGAFRFANEYVLAVRLLSEGVITVRPIITSFPLAQAVEAFQTASQRTQQTKVQIVFPERALRASTTDEFSLKLRFVSFNGRVYVCNTSHQCLIRIGPRGNVLRLGVVRFSSWPPAGLVGLWWEVIARGFAGG